MTENKHAANPADVFQRFCKKTGIDVDLSLVQMWREHCAEQSKEPVDLDRQRVSMELYEAKMREHYRGVERTLDEGRAAPRSHGH